MKVLKRVVKKTVTRQLDQLNAHPKQRVHFRRVPSDAMIRALADEIERDGLINPVEITPDNYIICGHRRVAALKLLGYMEVRCWLRDDLAKAGSIAVEQRLINDNLGRQQLSTLEQAQCYLSLKQLAGAAHEGRTAHQDTRDFLAERFGVSGRKLDRDVRILLHSPLAVQDAYDAGKLSQKCAEKVASLPPADQQTIAQAIQAGEVNIEALVKQYLSQDAKTAPPIRKAYSKLIRDAMKAEVLYGHESEVTNIRPEDFSILARLALISQRLRKHAEQQQLALTELVDGLTE